MGEDVVDCGCVEGGWGVGGCGCGCGCCWVGKKEEEKGEDGEAHFGDCFLVGGGE